MAQYGSIPGVKINTSTGTASGVTIGRESYLILVGVGNADASVDVDTPTELEGRSDVEDKFGDGSDVAVAYESALGNGANEDYVMGIRADTTTESETPTSSSGTLSNTPVVPDASRVVAEDGSSNALEVEFHYESPPSAPSQSGIIHINPHTGEFESNDTVANIEYDHANWSNALWAAENVMIEAEFGVLAPLSAADSVKDEMQSVITQMRDDLKLVLGSAPTQYNATTDAGEPELDTSSFSLSYNDDTLFVPGPVGYGTEDAKTNTALNGVEAFPAVAGVLAGNPVTDPIYDDTLTGTQPLSQGLTRSEVSDLRDQYVIPVRDTGLTRLEDNHSTYDQDTEGGWERDFFRRRIVDLTMATLYQVARQQMGSILDDDTIEDVAQAIDAQLDSFADQRLLEQDGQEFSVYRDDDRTIAVDATISPYGVAKGAEIDLQINA